MNFDQVKALRPTEQTSAAIQDSIDRARAAQTEARAKATKLDADRAKGLLTASDDALLKMEADAAAARLGADRIDALLLELERELSAAKATEQRAEHIALIDKANASGQTFAKAWAERYAEAASVIAGLMQLEALHLEDLKAAFAARNALTPGADVPELAIVHVDLFGSGAHILGEATQLPGEGGDLQKPGAFWRPRDRVVQHWHDGIVSAEHAARVRAENVQRAAEPPRRFPIVPPEQQPEVRIRPVPRDPGAPLDWRRDDAPVVQHGGLVRREA